MFMILSASLNHLNHVGLLLSTYHFKFESNNFLIFIVGFHGIDNHVLRIL